MLLSKEFLGTALAYAQVSGSYGNASEVTLSIDSRTVEPGEVFLALKGPQFDGHNFITQALEKGASALVVSGRESLEKVPAHLLNTILVIFVPDTFKALVDLAKAWRQQLTIPVVAITGS